MTEQNGSTGLLEQMARETGYADDDQLLAAMAYEIADKCAATVIEQNDKAQSPLSPRLLASRAALMALGEALGMQLVDNEDEVVEAEIQGGTNGSSN